MPGSLGDRGRNGGVDPNRARKHRGLVVVSREPCVQSPGADGIQSRQSIKEREQSSAVDVVVVTGRDVWMLWWILERTTEMLGEVELTGRVLWCCRSLACLQHALGIRV